MKDTNTEEVVENKSEETSQEKPEPKVDDEKLDRQEAVYGPLIIICAIAVLVIFFVFVVPALKPSRFWATSVIKQSQQEGYFNELFE